MIILHSHLQPQFKNELFHILHITIVSGNMTIEKKDDKESPCQIPLLMLSRPNCLPVHHAVANIGVIYLTASQPRYKHWHLLDFVMVRTMRGADCSTDHVLLRSTVPLSVRK